jgi:hypothetical protein
MAYKAKNNAYSTLAGAISDAATTLTVQPGHGDRFPVIAGADFTFVTLEDNTGNREVIKITARASASDTMTIERGQADTLARAWGAGDSIELRMIASLVQDAFAHVTEDEGAHEASAIAVTPEGGIASADVQAALEELDTKKLSADPSAVQAINIANGAVTTLKIVDANVTTPKLADGAVTNVKMAAGVAIANIGYTPVQQGTGVGQTANVIKIGWSAASKLKLTVDAAHVGDIAMIADVTTMTAAAIQTAGQNSQGAKSVESVAGGVPPDSAGVDGDIRYQY